MTGIIGTSVFHQMTSADITIITIVGNADKCKSQDNYLFIHSRKSTNKNKNIPCIGSYVLYKIELNLKYRLGKPHP